MAKIENLGAPVILHGVVFDQSILVMGVAADETGAPLEIKLEFEDSELFLEFCQISRLRNLIESDLQCLFEINGVNYLTAHVPLITFRQEFQPNNQNAVIDGELIIEITNLLREQNNYKNKFNNLLSRISQQVNEWKKYGVDLVEISGVDLRKTDDKDE